MKNDNKNRSGKNEPPLTGNIPVDQLVKQSATDAHKAIKKEARAAKKKESVK